MSRKTAGKMLVVSSWGWFVFQMGFRTMIISLKVAPYMESQARSCKREHIKLGKLKVIETIQCSCSIA